MHSHGKAPDQVDFKDALCQSIHLAEQFLRRSTVAQWMAAGLCSPVTFPIPSAPLHLCTRSLQTQSLRSNS